MSKRAYCTETVLFNESIAYNLKYGRADATQHDIEEAAKAARIYDRILSFPDGKNSFYTWPGALLSQSCRMGNESRRARRRSTGIDCQAY